jgi:uncharacterized protein YukE
MQLTVSNDPEAIHSYRQQIVGAIEKLEGQLKKTESAVNTVAQGWKDNQFQQFQQNFDEDKARIPELCNVLRHYDEHILYDLEQKLNNYLDVNMHL